MTFAITGASGNLGGKAIRTLKTKVAADEIVAIVRDPAKGEALGVPYRIADYNDLPALEKALAGIDELLFVSSSNPMARQPEHKNVIAAAVAAKVGHVAYTSCLHADGWGIPFTDDHVLTEKWLAESGLAHTVLRNGWYWENNTARLPGAVAAGALVGCTGGAPVSWASQQDLADAGVAILLGDAHRGQLLELAGDKPHTMADIAAEASRQLGREIANQDVPESVFAGILESVGLPPHFAAMVALIEAQGVSTGVLREDNGVLGKIIGRPTQSLHDAVTEALTVVSAD